MGGVIVYKGYKRRIESSYMEGCHSFGTVYRNGLRGSPVEVARIEGKIFKTMKEAEAQGLELAKEWVDKRLAEFWLRLLREL